jgi:hypothetical protein
MSKWFIYGLAVGLVLLAVAGVGASRRHQRNVQEEKDRAELAQYKEELADATQVQIGVLTERQRLHSRLYEYRATTNNTIKDLVAHARGRILGIDVSGQGQALTESQTPESYFGHLVHASDAVIRGSVKAKISQITEDGAFVFTDYDVVLTEVLKDNSDKPLGTVGSTIIVTRPGGKVLIDGIIVKASDRGFEPLPLNRPLLLFLRYIPETEAYRATRDVGTFEVDGSSIRPITKSPFPPGVLRDGLSSLQTIRAVSTR